MQVIVFEVWPKEGRREDYMAMAAELRGLLAEIPGFVSVERFESLTEPGKLLSLSFWEDEEAIRAWRETRAHRVAQALGRSAMFADYRLRVAAVSRDYGMTARDQAPADSRAEHG